MADTKTIRDIWIRRTWRDTTAHFCHGAKKVVLPPPAATCRRAAADLLRLTDQYHETATSLGYSGDAVKDHNFVYLPFNLSPAYFPVIESLLES